MSPSRWFLGENPIPFAAHSVQRLRACIAHDRLTIRWPARHTIESPSLFKRHAVFRSIRSVFLIKFERKQSMSPRVCMRGVSRSAAALAIRRRFGMAPLPFCGCGNNEFCLVPNPSNVWSVERVHSGETDTFDE